MIVQAILLGLIAFIGKCDLATGTNMIQRPIVLGPLVGLVLGDLSAGITIGATLELFFLGSISVGAYIPPNVIVGGVLGTAFAISTGQGTEAAITLAMPIALIAQAVDNVLFSLVRPLLAQLADRYAAKGNTKAVCVIHMGTGFITCTVLFLLTFLGFCHRQQPDGSLPEHDPRGGDRWPEHCDRPSARSRLCHAGPHDYEQECGALLLPGLCPVGLFRRAGGRHRNHWPDHHLCNHQLPPADPGSRSNGGRRR